MAAGKIEILVQTEVKKSIENMKKQIAQQNKVKKSVNSVASSFKALAKASGIIFAIKKVIDFTKANRDLADVQAISNTKLNSVLKATKGVAGMTSKELQNMASEFQNLTMIGDEVTMSAQATLLTFRNIGEDVFPRTIMAVMDMSQMFGSLESSSLQVGKALNDPITGITALNRVGITFSDTQKEQIKLFQKNGEMAKAQGIILTELENQFGGTAIAMAKTAKGVRTQLANEFGDIQESLGEGWNKISQPSNKKLLEFIKENKAMITGIFSNLPEVAGLAFDTAKTIIRKFVSWEGLSSMGKTIYESFQIAADGLPELLYHATRFSLAPITEFSEWTKSIFDNLWGSVGNSFLKVFNNIPIIGKKLVPDDTLLFPVKSIDSFGEHWNDTLNRMAESGAKLKEIALANFGAIGKNMSGGISGMYSEDLKAFKAGVEKIIEESNRAKEAKDLLDSSSNGPGAEVKILSFAEGLHSQILALEKERLVAKENLVVVQGLISSAERDGLGIGSSQMAIYLEEEKALLSILGLKEREIDQAGELEKRMEKNWDSEKGSKYYNVVMSISKATDWVTQKAKEYAGVIDSFKSTFAAWESYSENQFNKEMSQMEQRLSALQELNEETLSLNEELYNSELDSLNDYLDNDIVSRDEYLKKKAIIDAKKTAQDKKATAEADALEKEITRKKNEEAKKRFDIDKTSSIASATIAGALAIVQALTLGPIAGPIAAGIIGIAAGVQIGYIASEQFIPQYDVGSGNIPNDQIAKVHKGEMIVTKTLADDIRSGKLSLSGGMGAPQGNGSIFQYIQNGDVYDGDEAFEKFYDGVEEAQRQGRLPKWQHIA